MKSQLRLTPALLVLGLCALSSCTEQVDLGSDVEGSGTEEMEDSGSGGTSIGQASGGANASGGAASGGAANAAGGTTGAELCTPSDLECSPTCDAVARDACPDGLLDAACACWVPCEESYCVRCGAVLCEADALCIDSLCEEVEDLDEAADELQAEEMN